MNSDGVAATEANDFVMVDMRGGRQARKSFFNEQPLPLVNTVNDESSGSDSDSKNEETGGGDTWEEENDLLPNALNGDDILKITALKGLKRNKIVEREVASTDHIITGENTHEDQVVGESIIMNGLSRFLLTFGMNVPVHTLNTTEVLRRRFRRERGLPPVVEDAWEQNRRVRSMTWIERVQHCIPLRVAQQGALALILVWTACVLLVPLRMQLPSFDVELDELVMKNDARYYSMGIYITLHLLVLPRVCLLPMQILYNTVPKLSRLFLPLFNAALFGLAVVYGPDEPHSVDGYWDEVNSTSRFMWLLAHICFVCNLFLPLWLYYKQERFDHLKKIGEIKRLEEDIAHMEEMHNLAQLTAEDDSDASLKTLPKAAAEDLTTSMTGKIGGVCAGIAYVAYATGDVYGYDGVLWYTVTMICIFIGMLIGAKKELKPVINDPGYLFTILLSNAFLPARLGSFFLTEFLDAEDNVDMQVFHVTWYVVTVALLRVCWQAVARFAFTPVRCISLVYPLQQVDVIFLYIALLNVKPWSGLFFVLHIILLLREFLFASGVIFYLYTHCLASCTSHDGYTEKQLSMRCSELWQLKSQQFMAELVGSLLLMLVVMTDLSLGLVQTKNDESFLGLPVATKSLKTGERAQLLLVLLYMMVATAVLRPMLGGIRSYLTRHLPAGAEEPEDTSGRYFVEGTDIVDLVDADKKQVNESEPEPPLPPPPPPGPEDTMCYNCETEVAVLHCESCPHGGDLCADCENLLHLAKRHKKHTRRPIVKAIKHPKAVSFAAAVTQAAPVVSSETCFNCETSLASMHCQNCAHQHTGYLCSACEELLHLAKRHQDHIRVKIEDMTTTTSSSNSKDLKLSEKKVKIEALPSIKDMKNMSGLMGLLQKHEVAVERSESPPSRALTRAMHRQSTLKLASLTDGLGADNDDDIDDDGSGKKKKKKKKKKRGKLGKLFKSKAKSIILARRMAIPLQTVAAAKVGRKGLKDKLDGLQGMQNVRNIVEEKVPEPEEENTEVKSGENPYLAELEAGKQSHLNRLMGYDPKGILEAEEKAKQPTGFVPELHLEKVDKDGRAYTVLFEGKIFIYVLSVTAQAVCLGLLYASTATFNSMPIEEA